MKGGGAMDKKKDYKLFKVAYSYYIDKLTQEQISKLYGISRSNVSMMLNEARRKGIVEFSVRFPDMYCDDLARELERAFGIKKAIVISDYYDNEQERISFLADAAVKYLDEIIKDDMVIGVSWGKNVYEIANSIEYKGRKNLVVTPLVGGIGNEVNQYHSNLIAAKMAENLRASALNLYAPVFVGSEETKNVLFEDKNINDVLSVSRNADIAIVGIGNPKVSTMMEMNILSDDELENIVASGAVGDTNTSFVDKDGKETDSMFRNKTIHVSLEDLRKIPTVLAIAGGEQKLEAIHAVLKSGVLEVLVTDETVASGILKAAVK